MSRPFQKTVEHYPVDRLPAELRRQAEGAKRVTLSIKEERETTPAETSDLPKYLRFWAVASHKDTSIAEAVTRVRKLRDEW